jgi:methionyl aminopeptidase
MSHLYQRILQPKKALLADQRRACEIVTEVLLELKQLTIPDVSLDMLDELAERRIIELGGKPYNRGYKPSWSEVPYPNTICCSVNEEICHAPPRGRFLKDGDIVKYDLGVRYKSGCGDAAMTVAVGEIDNRKARAMRHGLQALYEGIKVVRAGIKIGEIGEAIEKFLGPRNYRVIREFGGHHIGKEMHEHPLIPHFADYTNPIYRYILQEGAMICIEPMVVPNDVKYKGIGMLSDGWTAVTMNHQPVIMFEHQLLVTKDGCEILTKHLSI